MLTYLVTLFLVGMLVYLNFVVSYCVVLSDGFSPQQKISALALCWLLPIIGSCLILYSVLDDIPVIRKRGWGLSNFLFLSWVLVLNKNGTGDDCRDGDSTEDGSDM